MIILLGSMAVFFGIWAIYYQLEFSRERQRISDRVSNWQYENKKSISWSDQLADKIDQTKWAEKIKPQLDKASLSIKPSEYFAFVFLGGVGIFFALIWGLGAPVLISISVTVALTPMASKMFLKSRSHIYAKKVEAQLSETCRLLSSTAKAGLSISQGLEIVVKEMPAPIKTELGIVEQELKLGRDLESSLNELLERVDSRDLKVFVNALVIQRRAGGDLARVMSEMARTMEERKIINQTIQAVTAQARTSAYALPIISVFVVLMLSKIIDGFYELFTSAIGMVVLVVFVSMQVLGVWLVRKISDIKV
jgi:tight adherence protein B